MMADIFMCSNVLPVLATAPKERRPDTRFQHWCHFGRPHHRLPERV